MGDGNRTNSGSQHEILSAHQREMNLARANVNALRSMQMPESMVKNQFDEARNTLMHNSAISMEYLLAEVERLRGKLRDNRVDPKWVPGHASGCLIHYGGDCDRLPACVQDGR